MATKKASKKITKTAFILSLPRDLPAAEAVEKAKAAGIKGLSETYVYKIRSRTKTAGVTKKGKPGPKPKGKLKSGAKKKGGRGSASDFVRSMPASTPAKKVVAAAAKRGLKISEGTVYQTRAYDRSKRGGSKSKPGSKSKTPKFQVFPGGGGGSETELKQAALAVGFPRAREVVEELERGYMALLG